MSQSIDPSGRGFQFPGEFEISAMGAADAGLSERIPLWLAAVGLQVVPNSMRQRASRQGNYLSVTVCFRAASRAEYDAAHAALRAHPEVKWTL